MTIDFSDWLQKELADRDMTSADLARITRKDQGIFSRILRRERKPDNSTLRAIAKAFKLPADIVFRAAGELPLENENLDEWVEEMNYKLNLIPKSARGVAEKVIESLIEEEPTPAPNPFKKHKSKA
jgi:transcriptional regulator with XRE-family HTH domain